MRGTVAPKLYCFAQRAYVLWDFYSLGINAKIAFTVAGL